jgi:hypothetical protein
MDVETDFNLDREVSILLSGRFNTMYTTKPTMTKGAKLSGVMPKY